MKPNSSLPDDSKLGQLLKIEFKWPIFHEAKGRLFYTLEKKTALRILGENGDSALENMFAQRSQTMQHLRGALVEQFLEMEPQFQKEGLKEYINEFVGFFDKGYPEKERLEKKLKDINESHSQEDAGDIGDRVNALPSRKDALKNLRIHIIDEIKKHAGDAKHITYLELAVMLDNQIGEALKAQDRCKELRKHVTRLITQTSVLTHKADQRKSADLIISDLVDINGVLQDAKRFTSHDALTVVNKDLPAETSFAQLTRNLETFGKATQKVEKYITRITARLEKDFPPEQHSQKHRS